LADRYLVFRCQHCGHFTYSPIGQKTRVCSYCGKVIKISTANAIIVDDKYKAALLVKKFNMRDGWKDFKRLLEAQREKVLEILEVTEKEKERAEKGSAEEIVIAEHSKVRRLLKLLEERCSQKPLHLNDFRKLCAKYGLEEEWALSRIEAMARDGMVIFPDPWHIQYMSGGVEGIVVSRVRRKVAVRARKSRNPIKVAMEFFRRMSQASYDDFLNFMLEEGFSSEQADAALEALLSRGMVIKNVSGTYEWVGG